MSHHPHRSLLGQGGDADADAAAVAVGGWVCRAEVTDVDVVVLSPQVL